MAIWDKMFNSNKNDDQNSKGNLAGDASKMLIGLKTKKIKMYVTLGLFGVFAFMFVLVFVASLIVGPLYTNDKKASETWSGYEGDAQLSAYQQEIIDKYGESVTSYDMSTDSYNEITQELYYEKLNQVYEQYLKTPNIESVESNGSNWFVRAWTAIKNFFTGGDQANIPVEYSYGVEIDSRLITSTLYAERFLGTSLDDDDQNAEFYVQEVADDSLKYRNLHSTTFRDETEKQYLEEAAGDLQSRQMLAVNGIEILSKYMIKRVETYITIVEEPEQYEFHDTTRNIEINYVYMDCVDELSEYLNIIDYPIIQENKVIYGGKYSWDKSNLPENEEEKNAILAKMEACPLEIADDSKTGDHNLELDDENNGIDTLRYDIDCDTYKNYLDGVYPMQEHIEAFGGAETYKKKFIEAYYHEYLGSKEADPEEWARKHKMIVDDNIYGMTEFYQNAENHNSICFGGTGISTTGDISCGGSVTTEYMNNNYNAFVGSSQTPIINFENLLTQIELMPTGTDKERGEKIMAVAKAFVISGENVGDCSSLVRKIYRNAGFPISGASATLAKNSYNYSLVSYAKDGKLDTSNMLPGDLIFWQASGSSIDPDRSHYWQHIQHVAVYAGTTSNGTIMIIESNTKRSEEATGSRDKAALVPIWGDNTGNYHVYMATRPYTDRG